MDGSREAELERREAFGRLDLGYLFGRYGEVRLGVARSTIEVSRESGTVPEELDPYLDHTIDRGGLVFSGIVDRLDNAKLPKNGGTVQLAALWALDSLGAEDEYTKLELRTSGYRTRERHTGFANLRGGVSPNSVLPIYDRFVLGGLFSLSGFAPGEIAGDNYGSLRAGYYYRLTKLFHVGGFGEAARVGNEPEDIFTDPILTLTALLVADTPGGPLYIAFGGADEGQRSVYIQFGRLF